MKTGMLLGSGAIGPVSPRFFHVWWGLCGCGLVVWELYSGREHLWFLLFV